MKYEPDYRKRSWVDFTKVRDIFIPYLTKSVKKIYTIEKLIPRSSEGESSSFVNGNSLGIFQGLYAFINPDIYNEPLPIVWKREMGLTAVKEKSIALAEYIYDINLRDYLKKGKTDDLAEALLISFYGLKLYFDSN